MQFKDGCVTSERFAIMSWANVSLAATGEPVSCRVGLLWVVFVTAEQLWKTAYIKLIKVV